MVLTPAKRDAMECRKVGIHSQLHDIDVLEQSSPAPLLARLVVRRSLLLDELVALQFALDS